LDVAPQAAAFSDERNISQRLANEDTNAKVDLTGHSLGGHLALAFSSLFDSVTGQVTVFNAPGFKTETQAFFAKLGGSIPTNANGNVFNVAADEALVGTSPFNFVTRMHSQPGTLVDIAIEKQSNSDEPSPFLPQRNPGRTGATH
jgi:putative lipase involved disintegration of autophagic bodies